VFTGKDIILTVKVKGEPWPNIKWFKGTREMKTDNQRIIVTEDKASKSGTIKIIKSKTSDEGKYQVVLEHDGFVYDASKFSLYVKSMLDLIVYESVDGIFSSCWVSIIALYRQVLIFVQRKKWRKQF
jgi:hypothetical protein